MSTDEKTLKTMDADSRIKLEKKFKTQISRRIKKYVNADELKNMSELIDRMAFLLASLTETEELIRQNGYVEKYKNGRYQSGIKDSAYVRAHASLIKSYHMIYRDVRDRLSKVGKDDLDAVDPFQ